METPATDKPKSKIGRPEGSINKLAREARETARLTGRLPHEILLDIARGEVVQQKRINPSTGLVEQLPQCPTLEQRIDAAKAAAPYYAPKISTVEVISGVSDHELDRIIAQLATEAGIDLGHGGEEPENEAGAGQARSAGDGPRRRSILAT